MSLTYGFYNSQNGDRVYDANQISSIFDGVITDGIFEKIGEALMVSAGSGMTVNVGEGRAWFNHTWTYNDALMPVEIQISDLVLNRIDTIVIDVNRLNRTNGIIVVSGTPASTPEAPSLIYDIDSEHYQYPLCDIYIAAGVTEITQGNIKNRVGIDSPFVTGAVQSVSVDALVAQWQAGFDSWMDELRGALDGDVATNLANRILELEDDNAKYKDLFDHPEMHRNIFRGKYLGNQVTEAQLAAIRNGSFENLYVGDYWTLSHPFWSNDIEITRDVNWRIADINYWLGRGDTPFDKQHLVLISDDIFEVNDAGTFKSTMGASNTTSGGYTGSRFRNTPYNYPTIKNNMDLVFGDIVLTHREYFTNAASNGYPTAGSWYDSTYDLPNEIMIFGCHIFAAMNNGSTDVCLYTIDNTQLALFRLHPELIRIPNKEYWLRDIANSSRFAFVSKNGEASYGNASGSKGYRMVLAIG